MRSLKRQRKKSVKIRRARLQLESLNPRLLLSASANWFAQQNWVEPEEDFGNFIKPGYGTPDAFYSDPTSWGPAQGYGSDTDFAQPAIVSVNDNPTSEHPVSCSCPACMGLVDVSESQSRDDSNHDGELDDDSDFPPAEAAGGGYVLYLDFDGERVYSRIGDFWLGGNYVDIPAYDLSAYGWGGREVESAQYIEEFVREDYAAYNISVTTTEPASGEYTTIYVGGNNDWFSPGSGIIGVATYDVGNHDPSNYGFAFPDELGIYYNYSGGELRNFSEYLANLITHEAGHTYGANHVSDTTAIMNPYLPLSPRRNMFGEGQIPGSASYQDTQSLFGSNIGYAHGEDDYGDNYTDAQSISPGSILTGLLERRDDTDAFTFTASASGAVNVDIDTTDYGNLDSYLKVYRTSDLALMAQNDDYSSELDSYCSFEAVDGVQYTVLVSSASSTSSGSYTLTLEQAQGDPVPELSITDSLGAADDLTMNFPSVMAGQEYQATFLLTNNGSADLVVSQLTASGSYDLSVTSLPGVGGDDITIAPGANLQITVTFDPDLAGYHAGAITITSNDDENNPAALQLTGQAYAPAPDITVPATIDFGSFERGLTDSDVLIIANDGQEDLVVTNIAVPEPFTIISGFDGNPITITPGQDALITLEVTSNQRGILNGQVTIVSNDPYDSTVNVNLTAQVVGGVLTVHESAQITDDSQIHFGNVVIGDSEQYTITLENSGDADLDITGLITDTPFVLDTILDVGQSGDDITLAAGQSVTIAVTYIPTQMGADDAVVTITTDDIESSQAQIQLYANAIGAVLDIVESDGQNDGLLDPGIFQAGENLQFDAWLINNNGTAATTINLNLAEGANYQLISPGTILLQPGQSYTVQLEVQTQLARTVTDTLILTADDVGQTEQTLALTADGYALIAQGQPYRFIDHSGDRITVSINGDAQAAVTIGSELQPDIQSIEILTGSGLEKLNIKIKGSGSTQLGQITGSADLKTISGKQVNLVGQGIDLDGSVKTLSLGTVLAGANIDFAADEPALIVLGHVIGDTEIQIDGSIKRFTADSFQGGSLQSDGIDKMQIRGNLDADVNALVSGLGNLTIREGDLIGNVTVNGTIDAVNIAKGDLLGSLSAQNNIGRVNANHGTISGAIQSGFGIDKISAENINDAEINCLTGIDKISVANNMLDSLVSVGFDDPVGARKANVSASGVDAVLGSLRIKGTFAGTTIAVGVAPDLEGSFIHGTANTASGTIGKVNIQEVNTDNGDDPFGLIAQDQIEKLKINRQSMNPDYQQDDFYINILNQ
jgi:HYDIN/CFA65/VesB family protein/centrosomal CEP192-like protein